jgi:flagellar biosynthetic protein FliP
MLLLAPAANELPAVVAAQPLRLLLGLTALVFLPALVASCTPFLRFTVVLHFLRQALGLQSAPSTSVLLSLAIFLTAIAIRPTATPIVKDALIPWENGTISSDQALAIATPPAKKFFLKFAQEKDLALIVRLSKTQPPADPQQLDLSILAPAYVLSELRVSFRMGITLYMPFIALDILIACLLLCIGMIQLPPALISAPFKILLFVLVDGWTLLITSLISPYI